MQNSLLSSILACLKHCQILALAFMAQSIEYLILTNPVVKRDEAFSLHGSKKCSNHLLIKYRLSPFHMLCPSVVGVLRMRDQEMKIFSSVPSRVGKFTF